MLTQTSLPGLEVMPRKLVYKWRRRVRIFASPAAKETAQPQTTEVQEETEAIQTALTQFQEIKMLLNVYLHACMGRKNNCQ